MTSQAIILQLRRTRAIPYRANNQMGQTTRPLCTEIALKRLIGIFAFALVLAACGDDKDDTNTFLCSDEADEIRCESGAQYCLKVTDGETEMSAECVALPDGCTDCDCAQDDAPNQEETACSASTVCTGLGNRVTVECIPPSS